MKESWIRLNLAQIFSNWCQFVSVVSLIAGFASPFVSAFIPEWFMSSCCLRLFSLLALSILIFIICTVNVYWKNCCQIWKHGKGSIMACYDDLFQIADGGSSTQYIVIPVNTAFDIQVDPPSVEKPLVSANTIHGKWLGRLEKWNLQLDEIGKQIEQSLNEIEKQIELSGKKCKSIDKKQKPRGRLKEYPIGTIVAVPSKSNQTIFLLTVLSRFDEKNNAHAADADLYKTIKRIVRYCNQNGQGCPVYLPVMGTGLSRIGLDDNEAFQFTKYALLLNKTQIYEKICIVVYKKDKDQISILN